MSSDIPDHEGVTSLLDTDLYKLTMLCAVLHSGYGDTDVTYSYTNRTPSLKLKQKSFEWLQKQVSCIGSVSVTDEEIEFLRSQCSYFPDSFLQYLKDFRLKPHEHVKLEYHPVQTSNGEGDLTITISGTWSETILYEIPLLILVSECYFRFSDTDWDYTNQEEIAYDKGIRLLNGGCAFSEFGTRRRRSYVAQELVIKGLKRATEKYKQSVSNDDASGKFLGTSNVHFAHRFSLTPIGTIAHEWYMGIAAITQDYQRANLVALEKWIACFGPGILGISLTDTFGTEQFLKCFKQPRPDTGLTYAEIFTGVRQDSGDPETYVRKIQSFYNQLQRESGRTVGRKVIVFSDSLNVDRCLKYKACADEAHFPSSFGVGTFFTNDFSQKSCSSQKSKPLNIVIKLASAGGWPAVKISDNVGKNTGDKKVVEEVKQELGYNERTWLDEEQGINMGDERNRWGQA